MARTTVRATVLSTGAAGGTGWASFSGLDAPGLDAAALGALAAETARRSADPIELDAGRLHGRARPRGRRRHRAVHRVVRLLGQGGRGGPLVHERQARAARHLADDHAGRRRPARLGRRPHLRLRGAAQDARDAHRRGRRLHARHRLLLGGAHRHSEHGSRPARAQRHGPAAPRRRHRAGRRDPRIADRVGQARRLRHAVPLRQHRGPHARHAHRHDAQRHVPDRERRAHAPGEGPSLHAARARGARHDARRLGAASSWATRAAALVPYLLLERFTFTGRTT